MTTLEEEPLLEDLEPDEGSDLPPVEEEHLDETSQEFVNDLVDKIVLFMDALCGGEPLFPYQERFARRVIESVLIGDAEEITALFSRQSGKALLVTELIPTPSGWVQMGALVEGDEVFAPDGKPVRVIEAHPAVRDRPCYRVEFSDGTSVVADAAHEWELLGGRRVETQHLVNMARRERGIPLTEPVILPNRDDLPIDPYTLGVWLGDGRRQNSDITSADPEIMERIAVSYPVKRRGDYAKYGWAVEGLYIQLCSAGLIDRKDRGLAGRKHIPAPYLRSSVEQRIALLQGLMDSDGHVTQRGESEFVTTDPVLLHDFLELCRSLGFRVRSRESRAMLNGKDCGPRWRVLFTSYADFPCVSLPRKAVRLKPRPMVPTRASRVYVEKAVPVAAAETRCISVEGGLFLCGKGWTVTHNSETVARVVAALMVLLPRLAKLFPELLGKFKDGFMVGLFAPVESQAETLFSRCITKLTSATANEILADPEIDDKVTGKSREIRLTKCGSFLQMATANPRAQIESKSYHLIVVDEAQAADDFVVRKCVAAGTPVWTPTGPVPVEDVVAGEIDVMTYNKLWDVRGPRRGRPTSPRDREVGELVAASPSEWHDNGVQPVWRVTTASGRAVEATANHRWVIRKREGSRLPLESTTEQLLVGDALPLPVGGVFGHRGNEREGYFAGQMIGDGCTTGGRAQWCGHADAATTRMAEIAADWGAQWRVYTRRDSGLLEGAFVGGTVIPFLQGEGLLRRKGAEKGLYEDGYTAAFWAGLVAGLLDSDGHINLSGQRVEIALVTRRMIDQLQDGLQRLGVLSSIFVRPQGGKFGVDPLPLHVLTIKDVDSLRRLREIVTLFAGDKEAHLTELVESRLVVRGRRDRLEEKRQFGQGALAWDRIVSIEYAGEKPTYCVTVDPSHVVVWGGFAGFQSIHPMGAFYAATIVKTGTPTTFKGDFYKAIQLNKRRQIRRGARTNHYEANWKECAKHNPDYNKSVRKEMLRMGEDSDEFQLSFNLKWLLERGMFTTEAAMEELGDKSMEIQKVWTSTPVVVGIDPARKLDSTVVTVVWVNWDRPDEFGYFDHQILNWLEIQGDDWESQYAQIMQFLEGYNVLAVGVDAQGLGDVVAQRLQVLLRRRGVEVRSVSSNTPDQSKRWKHLMTLMGRGMVGWPAHAKTRRLKTYRRFHQQMIDAEKRFQGPHILIAAPDEAEAHDDYVDSLAIACAMTADLIMPEVQVSNNPFFSATGGFR